MDVWSIVVCLPFLCACFVFTLETVVPEVANLIVEFLEKRSDENE